MDTTAIPLTPGDDETTAAVDLIKAIAIGLVVAAFVFLGIVSWLTLQNTYAVVHGHNQELTNLQTDVNVVAGFGAGLEWQNSLICQAVHMNCAISPPGPPPRSRLKG